ncbi:MAG: hypothetical protein AB8B63_19880 [Granulosicoccus sp.]
MEARKGTTLKNMKNPDTASAELCLQEALADNLALIKHRWAEIRYAMDEKRAQQTALAELESFAQEVTEQFPDNAEALAWHGQVAATQGELAAGMSALKYATQARDLFEQSVAIDEAALEGTAHISLGALYYEVPGWPMGFGNKSKAHEHLTRALELFPDDIEANFYFAGYERKYGKRQSAIEWFERALELSREQSDGSLSAEGRQREIKATLDGLR